jgi:hypothetical protein
MYDGRKKTRLYGSISPTTSWIHGSDPVKFWRLSLHHLRSARSTLLWFGGQNVNVM